MLNLLSTVSENVLKSLTIMWQGVVSIFIVIGIIIAITYILNKITAPKKSKSTTDEDAE